MGNRGLYGDEFMDQAVLPNLENPAPHTLHPDLSEMVPLCLRPRSFCHTSEPTLESHRYISASFPVLAVDSTINLHLPIPRVNIEELIA